jgi:hypothetical protein
MAGSLAAAIALAAFAAGAVAARATLPAARVAVFAAAFGVGLARPVALAAVLVVRRFAGAFPAPRLAPARGARVVDAVVRLGVVVLATAVEPPRDAWYRRTRSSEIRPRVFTAMPCCRAQARTSEVGTAPAAARRPDALAGAFFAAFVARLAGRDDAARVDLAAVRLVVRFAVRPDEVVDLLAAAAVFFAALAVPRPRADAGRPRRPALVARRRRERDVSNGPTAFWNCSRCRAHRSNSRTVPAMSRRMCPAAT